MVACQDDMNLHGSLEQLVETVHPLDQLQSDACDEELLELLNDKSSGIELNDQGGKEAARCDDDVEDVPAVGAVACPAETIEPDQYVDAVHNTDEDEESIFVWK